MLDAPTYRPCPACDGTDRAPLDAYSQGEWQVVQCAACDFVYLHNPPAYEALEEDFAWEKTYGVKKEASKGSTWFSPIGRWFKTNVLYFGRNRASKYGRWFNNGNVLDIGCGDGGRIAPPMTPFGIELSRGLHAQSSFNMHPRFCFCIHAPGTGAILYVPETHFDVLIMQSFLEHETEALKVLKGAARALKPSGKIFVRVPNFGSLNRRVVGPTWCGFRHPDHVNYFTTASLRAIGAKAGLDMTITNKLTLPIDDNINALFSLRNQTQGAA